MKILYTFQTKVVFIFQMKVLLNFLYNIYTKLFATMFISISVGFLEPW